jgi:hypothetical protein
LKHAQKENCTAVEREALDFAVGESQYLMTCHQSQNQWLMNSSQRGDEKKRKSMPITYKNLVTKMRSLVINTGGHMQECLVGISFRLIPIKMYITVIQSMGG